MIAVRVAAAHHHRVGLAGQADVVGIVALAAQQHRVLGARHRLADGKFLDGESLPAFVRRNSIRLLIGRLGQVDSTVQSRPGLRVT